MRIMQELRAVGGFVPPMVLIAINFACYWKFYHPQTGFDFGVHIGFLFGFWRSEMFAGGNDILWLGLVGDIAFGVLLGVIGVLIAGRLCHWTSK